MTFLQGLAFSLWLIFGIHTQVQALILDMSVNGFDDQYEKCTAEMESIIPELLKKEKIYDPEFAETWEAAEKKWNKEKPSVPSGFRDEYGIAIMAYTNGGSILYSKFNAAVRDYGGWNNFHYHSLHYLMTRGVVLLRSSCWWSTWSLYRGIDNTYLEPEGIGAEVRFGQFASSSTNRTVAEGFGNDTFFTFTSCFGVKINQFSYKPSQEEVLIPVDEIFKVTNFTKVNGKNKFVLETTKRRCHYYNCDYLRKGGRYSTCVPSGGPRIFSSLGVIALLLCQFIFFN